MERKEFDPNEWIDKGGQQQAPKEVPALEGSRTSPVRNAGATGDASEVEMVIGLIEEARIDITATYTHWRNIGFALASAFGEGGRDYFQRVSSFYPRYEKGECDRQYDQCLRGKGHGITLKTFFYYAKQHPQSVSAQTLGIREGEQDREGERDYEGEQFNEGGQVDEGGQPAVVEALEQGPPTLPAAIYEEIPDFLKKVVAVAVSDEERDILLLGSLAALSSCLPKIHGIYDGKQVFANLFLFITARASAGKGRLVHCKQLVLPIHRYLREQARLLKKEYQLQLAEFNQKDKDSGAEKPGKPAEKMLLIPANNSTTGVFQLLHENEGRGMIFETEGDTLAQAFKSDYGNYSDGFRKAFHHETISYYRRTDREYVDIETPCISTILTGTPKQVSALIPSAENGLFSRFIFYYMNVQLVWKDVFSFSSDNSLDHYFNELSQEFIQFYKQLEELQEGIEFQLTTTQQEQFNQFFSKVQETYLSLKGLDYLATVRRLGLIAFRTCMIFSALRMMEDGSISERLVCEDKDFQVTLEMTRTLVQHASKVFSELPEEEQMPQRKNLKERFFEALPQTFRRKEYVEAAIKLGIPDKTAQRYIADFCKKNMLLRDEPDKYVNLVTQQMDILRK